jgi:WD40 repeat protein
MLGGGQNFAINGLCAMRYGTGEAEVCRMYSVDDSAVLRDWDIETGQCLNALPAHELGAKCVAARDGVVMTGSLDMSVKLWDSSSFECIATLDCVGDSVMRLEIVADKWLLAAGYCLSLLHLRTCPRVYLIVTCCCASAGTNSIKIWDMRSRKLYRDLDGCRWSLPSLVSSLSLHTCFVACANVAFSNWAGPS